MDTIIQVVGDSLFRVKHFFRTIRFFKGTRGAVGPRLTLKKNASPRCPFNILIVVENMSYTYDTRVQNIAKSLGDAGYQIYIICPRYVGDPKSLHLNGIHVRYYYLPPRPDGFLGYLIEYSYSFAIISLLAVLTHFRQRVDVLHVCNPPDFFFPLGKVFQRLGCQFIYDKHDCVPELFQQRFGYQSEWIHSFLRKVEDLTERTADHMLTTNESSKKNAIVRSNIPAQHITVVRNAPDFKQFPHEALPDPIGEMLQVGYVGNMNPQDCIDLLLKSVHYIKCAEGRTDLRFVLIGDGSAYEKLKQLNRDLKIDDIVEFTGRLAPKNAYQRLASVNICVQPDRKNSFTDTCTMVKDLEYMALAKPIVAFDLTETRHSCGESALYASNNSHEDFARQILKLAEDPDMRVRMGQLGRKRLQERFTWSHSERNLVKAYETVTMKRRALLN